MNQPHFSNLVLDALDSAYLARLKNNFMFMARLFSPATKMLIERLRSQSETCKYL